MIQRAILRDAGALALLGAAGLCVRPQISAIGPLVPTITADLPMTRAAAGLAVGLPIVGMGAFTLAFAFSGRLANLKGRQALGISLLAIATAALMRSASPDETQFLFLTVLMAGAVGVATVVVPKVVQELQPSRTWVGMAIFVLGMQLGATISAFVAVPLSDSLGTWRLSLGLMAVIPTILVAPLLLGRGPSGRVTHELPRMAGRYDVLLIGLFALNAAIYYCLTTWLPHYLSHAQGLSEVVSAAALGWLNVGATLGTVALLLAPVRLRNVGGLMALVAVLALSSTVALAVGLPPEPASILGGLGLGMAFPLLLSLPALAARSDQEVSSLSAVMVGAGYLLAAGSPALMGWVATAAPGLLMASISAMAGIYTVASLVARKSLIRMERNHRARLLLG